MKWRSLGVVFLLFISGFGSAQTIIIGSIVDINKQPVSYANVVLIDKTDSSIISFAISDIKGAYSLGYQSKLDSLLLTVSYIGYKTISQKVSNKNQQLDFILNESLEELEAILIKGSRGINQRGDTLSYSVDVFKAATDQTIADVLERLPGIEVQPNGQVLYQGRAIQKYYIEGLDLLEGRYSLANNNLPANAVEQVQVLENHQPIQVLNGFSQSDETSLNIKLKSNVTLTGEAKLGAGFSPALFDVNITPLLFTKKNQLIASYQANNTGNNVAQQLEILTIDDVLLLQEGNVKSRDWLSIPKIEPYQLNKQRWLDNTIHMIAPNYLVKIKNGFQLKTNLAYISDVQHQIGATSTNFFTSTDTISILEQTDNQLKYQLLNGGFILEKNSSSKFIKNKLEFSKKWSKELGAISGTNSVNQQLANPFNRLSNNLNLISSVGKKLFTFNSFVSYSNSPNKLMIYPGQFKDFLNGGNDYESISQKAEVDLLFTNNSLSFAYKLGSLTLTSRSGIIYKNEQLNSKVSTSTVGGSELGDEFENSVVYKTTRIYSEVKTQLVKNTLKLDVKANLSWLNLSIIDYSYNLNQNPNYFVLEPKIRLVNSFTSRIDAGGGYYYKNRFARLSNLYNGYILLDYRTFQRNTSDLPRSLNHNYDGFIKYKDSHKFFFANVFYTYSLSSSNLLKKTIIGDFGIRSFDYIPYTNDRVSHRVTFRTSKYLSKFRTTFSYNFDYSNQKSEQLINDTVGEYGSNTIQHGIKVKTNIADIIQMHYNFNINFYQNFNGQTRLSNYQSRLHSVRLLATLAEKHIFIINLDNYYNNISVLTSEDWFLDAKYRYSFKSGISLEAIWSNILNNKEYSSAQINPESSIISSSQLRPQQLLLSVKFRIKTKGE